VLAQDAQVPIRKAVGRVTPTGPVPSLAVINSAGAKLEGNNTPWMSPARVPRRAGQASGDG
jgi:hypothetical protein